MIIINTSLEIAQQRYAQRDRNLPDKMVDKIWKDVQKNMGRFQGLFKANFKIIDNSEKRVAKRAPKAGVIMFPKEFSTTISKFIKSPVKSSIAKRWMQRQLEMKKKYGMTPR